MATTETVPQGGMAEGQGGAAPQADTAQTDEQIVGLDPGVEAADASPEGAETAPLHEAESEKEKEIAAEPAIEESPKEEIPQDGRVIPAELREVFKANPKLRDAWFSERAYREAFPTVRAAREMAELFPGGIEDARLLRDASETLQHLDGLYVTNSQESHQALAQQLAELSPEAYPNFVVQAVNNWAARDPEGYRETVRATLADELPGWVAEQRLPDHTQALLQALERGDTEQAKALAQQQLEWTRRIGSGRPDRDRRDAQGADPEIERLRAQLAERDARDRQQAEESLRTEVTNRYVTEVIGFLEKAVPASSQRAREKMVGEVVNAINQQLAQSPAFMAQLNQLKAAGQMQEAANFVMARAKQLLPQAGRRILNEWTTEILAANKTTVQKKAAAAQSRDAGGGGAPSPAGTVKAGKVDYSKMSDADILGS
jgi:hypothetical protein